MKGRFKVNLHFFTGKGVWADINYIVMRNPSAGYCYATKCFQTTREAKDEASDFILWQEQREESALKKKRREEEKMPRPAPEPITIKENHQ